MLRLFRRDAVGVVLVTCAWTCAAVALVASCGRSHGATGAGGSGASANGGGGNGATGNAAGDGGGDLLPTGGWTGPPACDAGMSDATSSGAGGAGGMTSSGAGGATTGSASTGGSVANGCDGVMGGVHFKKDVGPILAACTGELCHLPPGYADLVGKPATECCDGRLLVAPFDAAHSYLVDKVHGTSLCYGSQMPFGAPPLVDADAQAIVRWICEGAPND